MMKHDFSLLIGNSISYPRYRTNKLDRRWLWLVLAAAALAVTALGFVGALGKPKITRVVLPLHFYNERWWDNFLYNNEWDHLRHPHASGQK